MGGSANRHRLKLTGARRTHDGCYPTSSDRACNSVQDLRIRAFKDQSEIIERQIHSELTPVLNCVQELASLLFFLRRYNSGNVNTAVLRVLWQHHKRTLCSRLRFLLHVISEPFEHHVPGTHKNNARAQNIITCRILDR